MQLTIFLIIYINYIVIDLLRLINRDKLFSDHIRKTVYIPMIWIHIRTSDIYLITSRNPRK